MEPRVITSQEDYERSLPELDRLVALNPRKDTPDADRLGLLALLIETYEKEHFPIDDPTPVEAIRFRMKEEGLQHRHMQLGIIRTAPYEKKKGR